MLAFANFPPPDPIPLPAPVWLFKLLHAAMLSLHFVVVQWVLGWLVIGVLWNLWGRSRSHPFMVAGSTRIAASLPILMTYLINFGIPPLLFTQVLYGNFLYTSSVLIGAWWLGIVGLVTLAYLALSSVCTVAGVYLLTSKRNALGFGTGAALAIAALAYLTIGSTEMLREMLRKPYVIGQYMFSNGVRKSAYAGFNQNGYLAATLWVKPEERARWAAGDQAAAKGAPLVPEPARGELMFRGQCMACHAWDGYWGMRTFLKDRDRQGVSNIANVLHAYREDSPYRAFMPPLVGTQPEVEALIDYLTSQISAKKARSTQTITKELL